MEHQELVKQVESKFQKDVGQNSIVLYGLAKCWKLSELAFKLVNVLKNKIRVVHIDHSGNTEEETVWVNHLQKLLNHANLPVMFVNQKYVGCYQHVLPMLMSNVNTMDKLLTNSFTYDYCVIGGGTCGLAFTMEARQNNVVALCDWNMNAFSDNGNGIGKGSRLNSEILPKFFLHNETMDKKIRQFNRSDRWSILTTRLMMKIRELTENNLQRVLEDKKVQYFDGRARFIDCHTVVITKSSKLTQIINAKQILVATGTEPIFEENIKGSELGITVDQLFNMPDPPKDTLLVGEMTKCMEIGGILKTLGLRCSILSTESCEDLYETNIMNDLRASHVYMGVGFLTGYKLDKLKKAEDRKGETVIEVYGYDNFGEKFKDHFNVVVFTRFGTGRTKMLDLNNCGLEVNKMNNKVLGHSWGGTDNPCVFVTGSVLNNHISCFENETGVQHTLHLWQRLQTNTAIEIKPTTFARIMLTTPFEYGAIGQTEQKAQAVFGLDKVTTYSAKVEKYTVQCVCVTEQQDRIVGIHVMGLRVADILQPFASLMLSGFTKKDFQSLVMPLDKLEEIVVPDNLTSSPKSYANPLDVMSKSTKSLDTTLPSVRQ